MRFGINRIARRSRPTSITGVDPYGMAGRMNEYALNTKSSRTPLRRILGAPTALLLGTGVAIGSGIFRAPGVVAQGMPTWQWMLIGWVLGAVIVLIQGLVSAELATRYPEAGGEYVYLREAYGDCVAFFFGWAYTIFVIGGGAATISLAFGDFACELVSTNAKWSGSIAAGLIIAVTIVNALGLRAGAGAQNALSILKILAILGVAAIGIAYGAPTNDAPENPAPTVAHIDFGLFLAAALPVLWSYSGTTDVVKMAEEIKDARRTLPRAIIGSTLLVAVVYMTFNIGLMRVVDPADMAGIVFIPGVVLDQIFGEAGRRAALIVAMLACLGSLSSTVLATIRVTYALARDGLTFRFMAHVSKGQAPVPALLVVACFSVVLVLNRDFEGVLRIYFLASTVLFGLTYATLIIFRLRDREFPTNVFRCPFGMGLAAISILIQAALAINIVYESPGDSIKTIGLLAALAIAYLAWKRFMMQSDSP